MEHTNHVRYWTLPLACILLAAVYADVCGESWDGKILEYGEMRQVLGLGHHEGRIRLGDLTEQPHCYAVGALAQLAGKVTILDGKIVATRVDTSGKPKTETTKAEDDKATMLVAAYVAKWSERRVDSQGEGPSDRHFCRGRRPSPDSSRHGDPHARFTARREGPNLHRARRKTRCFRRDSAAPTRGVS